MRKLGLCAYLQPFPPPSMVLGTCLWRTCAQGLQLATLQAAARRPAQGHGNQPQQ